MSATRTIWDAGHESGRQVVALGAAVALTITVLDLWLVGRVSAFFDLWFVVLCGGLALAVRRRDFFTVGVLPPLIMLGTFVLLAIGQPGVIGRPHDGVVQAVVSGLAHHSVALLIGYAVCLGTLLVRQRRAHH